MPFVLSLLLLIDDKVYDQNAQSIKYDVYINILLLITIFMQGD